MPFINVKTTKEITPKDETRIKIALGDAIEDLGKSEMWLMLSFEGNSHMYFKGRNDGDCAIAEVSLFGKASDAQYDKMTKDVTDILCDTLGLSSECVYVKYDEIQHWGYNGFNF